MPGIALTSALIGLHFTATVNGELGAGLVPRIEEIGVSTTSDPTLVATLSPAVGFIHPSGATERLRAAYSPRASWRLVGQAVAEPLDPVLVHQLFVTAVPVAGERTRLVLDTGASVGEVDFSLMPNLFGEGETARSEVPVVQLFTFTSNLTLSHAFTPRWFGSLMGTVGYQAPLGGSDDPLTQSAVSEMVTTSGTLNVGHRVTALDTLALSSMTTWAQFDLSEQLSTQVDVGWRRQMSTTVEGNVRAGVGRSAQLAGPPVLTAEGEPADEAQYFAVGGLGFSRQRQRGSETVELLLDGRVDPFLQRIRPLATLSISSREQLDQDFTLSAALSAVAPTDPDPIPLVQATDGTPIGTTASETGLSGELSLGWGKGAWRYGAGVRGSVRGTHWDVAPFEVREQLVMLFFNVNWNVLERE